jgi:hypothetical protein
MSLAKATQWFNKPLSLPKPCKRLAKALPKPCKSLANALSQDAVWPLLTLILADV